MTDRGTTAAGDVETPGSGEPEISVIVIFHNEERYLPDAVASVEKQSFRDWELLLVDDGSTDASTSWARDKAEQGAGRVRYLTQPDGRNRGMSAARNLGIGNARGRWITFLDADDEWLPDKIECQLRLLDTHPDVDVLVSPALWWRSWDPDQRGPCDWIQSLGVAGTSIVEPPLLLQQFVEDEWSSICDIVIDRQAALDVGGYEESFDGMFEDQVFHAKVFSSHRSLVTEQWWYRYRQHHDATTAKAHAAGDHDAARSRYLDWLSEYLSTTAHPVDPALRRQIRRQRLPNRFPGVWRVGRAGRRLLRFRR